MPFVVPVKLFPGANKLKLSEIRFRVPAPVFMVTLPALASNTKPWNVKLLPCPVTVVPVPKMTLPVCATNELTDVPARLSSAPGLKTILLNAVAVYP